MGKRFLDASILLHFTLRNHEKEKLNLHAKEKVRSGVAKFHVKEFTTFEVVKDNIKNSVLKGDCKIIMAIGDTIGNVTGLVEWTASLVPLLSSKLLKECSSRRSPPRLP